MRTYARLTVAVRCLLLSLTLVASLGPHHAAFAQQPLTITDVKPRGAAPGTPVRIRGAGFDATPSANTVTFGGVTAALDSVRSTVLYARVPSGLSGPVDVEVGVAGETARLAERFDVLTGGGRFTGPPQVISTDAKGRIDVAVADAERVRLAPIA